MEGDGGCGDDWVKGRIMKGPATRLEGEDSGRPVAGKTAVAPSGGCGGLGGGLLLGKGVRVEGGVRSCLSLLLPGRTQRGKCTHCLWDISDVFWLGEPLCDCLRCSILRATQLVPVNLGVLDHSYQDVPI